MGRGNGHPHRPGIIVQLPPGAVERCNEGVREGMMTLGWAAMAFVAGFVSVLIFHQGVWALYGAAGKAPGPAWNRAPVPPLGVPAVLSSAFWGGLWGIVLAWLLPIAAPVVGYWPAA